MTRSRGCRRCPVRSRSSAGPWPRPHEPRQDLMNQAPEIASADQVVISGFDVTCGAGRDPQALLAAVLAGRVDYQLARMSAAERADWSGAGLARALAQRCGLSGALRTYTGACVAG